MWANSWAYRVDWWRRRGIHCTRFHFFPTRRCHWRAFAPVAGFRNKPADGRRDSGRPHDSKGEARDTFHTPPSWSRRRPRRSIGTACGSRWCRSRRERDNRCWYRFQHCGPRRRFRRPDRTVSRSPGGSWVAPRSCSGWWDQIDGTECNQDCRGSRPPSNG